MTEPPNPDQFRDLRRAFGSRKAIPSLVVSADDAALPTDLTQGPDKFKGLPGLDRILYHLYAGAACRGAWF